MGCHLAKGFAQTGIDSQEIKSRRDELNWLFQEVEAKIGSPSYLHVPAAWWMRYVAGLLISHLETYTPSLVLNIYPMEENFYYASYFLTLDRLGAYERFARNSNDRRRQRPDWTNNPNLLALVESNLVAAEELIRNMDDISQQYILMHRERVRSHYAGILHLAMLLDPEIMLRLGPLTQWLLQQEKGSVSPYEFYDAALDLYQDAWIALAAMAVLTWNDIALSYYWGRNKQSVLASKMEPIINLYDSDLDDPDPYGSVYHFWNYLFYVVKGKSPFISLLLSAGYEVLLPLWVGKQADWVDHQVDKLAIEVGKAVNRGIDHPAWCDS